MRIVKKERVTKETKILLEMNLDGNGESEITTGIGFFDHMLTLFAFHASIDLKIKAEGDLNVCDHHLIEDCGILLGIALKEALGNKIGIQRYGSARVVMDEVLCFVDMDLCGRSTLVYNADIKREKIGDYSCEMTKEFLKALSSNAFMALHVNIMYGENDHHKVEAIFKGLARALKESVNIVSDKLMSTKGLL